MFSYIKKKKKKKNSCYIYIKLDKILIGGSRWISENNDVFILLELELNISVSA